MYTYRNVQRRQEGECQKKRKGQFFSHLFLGLFAAPHLVVLVVVQLHGGCPDRRLECAIIVRQRREGVGVGGCLGWFRNGCREAGSENVLGEVTPRVAVLLGAGHRRGLAEHETEARRQKRQGDEKGGGAGH